MSGNKYLSLEDYDGTLYGILPDYSHRHYIASPGGIDSLTHHWSGGLFGRGTRVVDAYSGTGDRYISGVYGNMYTPSSHADVHSLYIGPHSSRTDDTTMNGDSYYFDEKKNSNLKTVENFTKLDSDIELIAPPTILSSEDKKIIRDVNSPASKTKKVIKKVRDSKVKIAIWVGLIVIFVILEFLWGESIRSFLVEQGFTVSWSIYAIYAMIATIIFTVYINMSGILN